MRPLTRRQWLIWACWMSGMSYAQIGYTFGIAAVTVDAHLTQIKAKTGPLSRFTGPYDLPHL